MDTRSINKLNRFRYALDAIAARDYNENHGPDGRFTEGSSSSGSKSNKSAKSAAFKAATKGAEEVKLNKKALSIAKESAKQYLGFDDLDYWSSDSGDYWENDANSISVGILEDGLRNAYKAGKEKNGNKLSKKQIESNAEKIAEKQLNFSLKEDGLDGNDYWRNDRGHFSKWDLKLAFIDAYTKGYKDN